MLHLIPYLVYCHSFHSSLLPLPFDLSFFRTFAPSPNRAVSRLTDLVSSVRKSSIPQADAESATPSRPHIAPNPVPAPNSVTAPSQSFQSSPPPPQPSCSPLPALHCEYFTARHAVVCCEAARNANRLTRTWLADSSRLLEKELVAKVCDWE